MNKQIVPAMVALLAVAVSVSAEPIFVENFSFELPGSGKPGFAEIPGWSGEGPGGGGAETGWGATDGIYTGFAGYDMEVYNLTDHTIVANAEYTLTLDARRTWQGPDITIELYYDNAGARVPMGSLFHQFSGGDTTDMEELTLTIRSNDTPQSIGKKIGIQIKSGNPGGDTGWIGYDSVRLDHSVLVNAMDMSPFDGAIDVCRNTMLTWETGVFAVAHDVYLGTNFDDVSEATTTVDPQGVYRGQVGVAQFDISSVLILEYGQTYYWRIDEIDGPPTNTLHTGDVWQFTIEPVAYPIESITATASSSDTGKGPENTLNLEGDLHSNITSDMWLSGSEPVGAWILYEFDKIYKLREIRLWNYNGEFPLTWYGVKDATIEYSTNGVDYTPLGDTHEFAQAPGTADYAYDTVVDFGGAAAKYVRISTVSNHSNGAFDQYGLSEVRFLYVPMRASMLNPPDGAPSVPLDAVLSWGAGRGAAVHDLYLSTNKLAVSEGTIAPISIPADGSCGSFYAVSLELGKTYYWKVNEVNMGEEPDTWEGDVWSFSTPAYLVVDDITSYGDADEVGQPGSRIWFTWKDGEGWLDPSPAQIGNATGSVVDVDLLTVYETPQSMVYYYSSSGTNQLGSTGKMLYSEATARVSDLEIGNDWTAYGIRSLTLYFYGETDNDFGLTEQMYVKLNGAKVAYDGDASDVTEASWHEWNIDLAAFGINLQNVTEIIIGFGDENNTFAGGSGIVQFDDIRLHSSRCVLANRSAGFAALDYAPESTGGDCAIDHRELEIMMADWLAVDRIAPPLMGWYKFDEGSGTTTEDSSGNGNHGTLNGAPVWMGGHIGAGSLRFNGGDYVEVPHDETLTVDTEVTVMAWINAERHTSAAGDWQAILAKSNGPRSYSFYTYADGTLHFSTTSDGAFVGSNSTLTVALNEWVHVAAMVVGGMHRYYINGVPAGEDHSGIVLPGADDTATVLIGMTHEGGNGFLGMIDDVRIYDRALSESEIGSIMDGSSGSIGDEYYPLQSLAELDATEPEGFRVVNFKDLAVLADYWAQRQFWP